MATHRFTREDLYELVWSEPISRLAQKLGVSGRGLAKACARANIPVPGSGYWTRLKHGKTVIREPLPPEEPSVPTAVEIAPGPSPFLLSELSPQIQEQIAQESSPERRITMARTLSSPHPPVRAWLEQARGGGLMARNWPSSPRHRLGGSRRPRGGDCVSSARSSKN